MYTVKEIPEEHATLKEKESYLISSIKKDHKKITGKATSSTRLNHEMGCKLNLLKLIIKKQKLSFQKFVANAFPHINIRTIERAMKLATIEINKHPTLSVAGQTRLLSILKLAGKKPVVTFLRENRISIKFDPKNMKEVRRFKNQIDKILSIRKRSGKRSYKTAKDKLTMVLKGIRSYIEVVERLKDDEPELDTIAPGQLVHVLSEIDELVEKIEKIKFKLMPKSKRKKRAL